MKTNLVVHFFYKYKMGETEKVNTSKMRPLVTLDWNLLSSGRSAYNYDAHLAKKWHVNSRGNCVNRSDAARCFSDCAWYLQILCNRHNQILLLIGMRI